MKLLRLELFGFKSFLNRTVFHFSEGITSIVGPNGCGKSNIVDAIVWALGERGTKSLRIKDMGDVIFHGSNGKRPVNVAEVAVDFFDGQKEVAIKRRIYRDGTNEYYMNGTLVRLKDIQDFFLGTGVGLNAYAIVEQGRVEYFIQMKPQERRVLIEETSGITRFEEKKKDALMRMESVSTNLERVEDIYSEVIKNFERAEQEWTRWKAYKELSERLKEIDRYILIDGYIKLSKRIGRIKERQDDLYRELAVKEEERARLKEDLETKEREFSLVDTTLRQLEVDIKTHEKDMEKKLLEADYVKDEKKRLEEEQRLEIQSIETLDRQIQTIESEIRDLLTKTENLFPRVTQEEEKSIQLKEASENLKTGTEEYEKRLEDERVQFFVVMNAITDLKNRIADIERSHRERAQREEKRRSDIEVISNRLKNLEDTLNDLQETLEKTEQEFGMILEAENELQNKRDELKKAIGEITHTIERLKGEKQGKEAFLQQIGVKTDKTSEGISDARKLMDMMRVNEDFAQAIEKFFFKEMEYRVLTQSDHNMIAHVVGTHGGNYIFFPAKGIFTLDNGRVSVDIKWIDTIEEGLVRIEKGEAGIFINNEVCIDSRGFILGGSEERLSQFRQFKERLKIEKELHELVASLNQYHASLNDAQTDLRELEQALSDIQKKRLEKETMIQDFKRQIAVAETEMKTTQERLKELEATVEVSEEIPITMVQELMKEKELNEEEQKEIEAKMASLKEELDRVKKSYEDSVAEWHDITLSLEKKRNEIMMLQNSIERNRALIEKTVLEKEAHLAKRDRIEGVIKEIEKRIESIESDYEGLKKSSEHLIGRYEELQKASGDLHMERRTIQERIEAVAQEIEKTRSKGEGIEAEMAVLVDKQNTISDTLMTTYGIEKPEEAPPPAQKNLDEEREKIVKEIGELGEVNFRAEKEYMELKDRVAFLEKQKEDLRSAMDSLKKTIVRIDTLAKDIFSETFVRVNETFQRFVKTLFKGGKGYLSLTQDGSGVDMYVQPPGKKVNRMEQLSGGEKALVSIAFLLALMDTRPSPFSLLDEIDAPLDDSNLLSLLQIMKDISAKTQIVFITHNRLTMESSDTIYGITMEEEGVSKIVSVRL